MLYRDISENILQLNHEGDFFLFVCTYVREAERSLLKYAYLRGADKSLARPGRKQATATEDFDVHVSYFMSLLEEYYI
jgi:hypothetical protein